MILRVMTFNIQHCLDYVNRRIDYELFAKTIAESGADIVGLNEVHGQSETKGYDAQARILAEGAGYKYHYFAKAIDFNGRDPYGNAVLSKYPIISAETVMIPDPSPRRYHGYYETRCAAKLRIAKEHLVPQSMERMGIRPEELSFADDALETLISEYTMEAGVRGLRQHIETMCRVMAVKVAEQNAGAAGAVSEAAPEAGAAEAGEAAQGITVTADTVRREMDARPIRHASVLPQPKAGVVTGLAWTPAGGEILYIETMFTKGKGDLIITGQLGDVMKESVRIAVSLVKSLLPEKAELFEQNDLHIHVPAGAVPKDGPSAGVTLTTALASLVTGRTVDPHIAMTGEVSLRGAVTPIGGLPEKLMAAQRAGVRKVFIPEDNEYDLKEVAEEVKDTLEIVPVKDVETLLKAAGAVL